MGLFGKKDNDCHGTCSATASNADVPQVPSVGCFECKMMVVKSAAQRFIVSDEPTLGSFNISRMFNGAGGSGGSATMTVGFGREGIGFLCPAHRIPNLARAVLRDGKEPRYYKDVPQHFVEIDAKGNELKVAKKKAKK